MAISPRASRCVSRIRQACSFLRGGYRSAREAGARWGNSTALAAKRSRVTRGHGVVRRRAPFVTVPGFRRRRLRGPLRRGRAVRSIAVPHAAAALPKVRAGECEPTGEPRSDTAHALARLVYVATLKRSVQQAQTRRTPNRRDSIAVPGLLPDPEICVAAGIICVAAGIIGVKNC